MARILHLIAANHRRGAETFAVELADHLRGVGHEVRVMSVVDAGLPAAEALPVEVAGTRRFDPIGFQRILGAARWADVVVSFGSTSLLTGAVAAKLLGRPFVYRNIGDPSVWGQARLSGLRIGSPVRTAARVVALYPDAARTLRSWYRLDPNVIRVIPRGVPEERFTPATGSDRLAACERLTLDSSMRWLAYVGALSAEKDPLLAIESLHHLDPDVGLVVAGGGPLEAEALVAAAPLGDRVRFVGVVDDVRPVYAAAEALALPSHTEGIPGAAVEAGLSGLPTIAFAVGGVPSVVDDGVTGRLAGHHDAASFADAARDVLGRRDEMGAAARERCQAMFSMRGVGAAWEKIIAEVVTDAVPSRRGRVLQVTASTERRGAEVFADQLAGGLASRGYDVSTVAVTPHDGLHPLPFRTLGPGRFRPSTLFRLVRTVRAHDVAIAHGGAGLWPCMVASALARRPFLYRGIGEPSYWGDVPFGRLRIGLPLRRAAGVVPLYAGAAGQLVDMYGLDPEKVTVIPNAVPAERFPPLTPARRDAARSALGVGPDTPVLGYLGALSSEKRPEWAIRTVAGIDGARLVVAGSGPLDDELRSLADRLAPGRVQFLGSVTDPAGFLAGLDVLVLPSATEGVPAIVIEAALIGIPVVATDVGGVAEVVDHLAAGAVVPAEDHTAFVAATEHALSTSRPLGTARAATSGDRYDLGAVTGSWDDLIERVIDR